MRGTPHPYYVSLNRPILVSGVEHELFYLILCISILIAFSARLSLTMDLVGIATFFILMGIGNLLARIDPQMLAIYKRHIHYRKYYAAQPGLHAELPLIKPSVPFYVGKEGLI